MPNFSGQVVTINGRFLSQRTSGVQRYAREILGAIGRTLAREPDRYADLSFQLALPSDVAADIPDNLGYARPIKGKNRGYVWEQGELPKLPGISLNLCNLAPFTARRKIVCIHDANIFLAPESYDWKYRAFQRISMPILGRTSSAVITVSNSSARALAASGVVHDIEDVTVAPNGHEHALAWQSQASSLNIEAITSRPFVVMLGARAPHKNLALVRTIAPVLAERGIDCIVTGSLDGVFTDKATADLSGVHAIGHVSDDDIALLFSYATCLLFPSYVEGFGLPLVEAMAHGCPVVASDRSSMPEICGDAGLLRSPDDPASWIEAIYKLASEEAFRSSQIRAGSDRARLYSWTRSAQIYLDLICRMARPHQVADGA